MKPSSELESLLLQAAGRTGGGSSSSRGGRKQQQQQQRSYSSSSSSEGYSAPPPTKKSNNKSKSKQQQQPPPVQVPLKKRPQEDQDDHRHHEASSSDASDAPSVGSDLYKDDLDKEHLQSLTELDREMILAERSTRIDDYRLKKLALARAPSSRSSARAHDTKSAATRTALDQLLARRRRHQDPDAYRNRLKHLAADTPHDHLPQDRDTSSDDDDDDDRKDEELPDDSPSSLPHFDDIRDITILRSRLLKWFMDPFFEDLLPGCFVRIGIHQTKDGHRKYRLYMVRSVDASDPNRTYKFEHYTTCKYLVLITRTETSIDKCRMSEVSDSSPTDTEFQEWLQLAETNGMRIPSRQELADKKEAIQRALNFVYSAETVKQLLQEKKLASLRPANVAAEKDRLRKELEVARARHDEAEADRILARLKQLEQVSLLLHSYLCQ